MTHLAASVMLWILDSAAAAVVVLLAGRCALGLVRRPAARQRIAEWSLAGCLLAAVLAALPGVPRMGLGLVTLDTPAPLAVLPQARFDYLPNVANHPAPNGSLMPVRGTPAPHSAPAVTTLLGNLPWFELAVLAYAAGMLLVAAYLAMGHWALWWLARTARKPDVRVAHIWARIVPNGACSGRLLVSPHVARPLTYGLWHPVVLLPAPLCQAGARRQLVAVLRHEAVHVARHDALAWTLAALVQVLFFYQPLYWMLRRDLRVAQELVADAWAARYFPSPAAYARELLQVLYTVAPGPDHLPALPAAVGRPAEFFLRMRELLEHPVGAQPRCTRWFSCCSGTLLLALAAGASAMSVGGQRPAAAPPVSAAARVPAWSGTEYPALERRGLAYLLAHQDPGGAWLPQTGPAMTALVVKALLQAGEPATAEPVRRGLAFIEQLHQPDEGYYLEAAPSNPTYNTAIVLSTLSLLPGPAYRARVAGGRHFLELATPSAPSTPLSTANPADDAAWTIEALHDSGVHHTSPVMRAALARVAPGFSPDPTERTAGAVLANYGTLTYAGLKSMLYAGLTRDDPRVQLAIRWIRQNYTLECNPADRAGRGQFYYYHTFAKALGSYGENPLTDARGVAHNWKAELRDRLAALQNPDGSWVNQKAGDYLENNPLVVTTYGVLALQETRK